MAFKPMVNKMKKIAKKEPLIIVVYGDTGTQKTRFTTKNDKAKLKVAILTADIGGMNSLSEEELENVDVYELKGNDKTDAYTYMQDLFHELHYGDKDISPDDIENGKFDRSNSFKSYYDLIVFDNISLVSRIGTDKFYNALKAEYIKTNGISKFNEEKYFDSLVTRNVEQRLHRFFITKMLEKHSIYSASIVLIAEEEIRNTKEDKTKKSVFKGVANPFSVHVNDDGLATSLQYLADIIFYNKSIDNRDSKSQMMAFEAKVTEPNTIRKCRIKLEEDDTFGTYGKYETLTEFIKSYKNVNLKKGD